MFLLLADQDQLLFVLRSGTGWMDGKYSVPGGVKESFETLPQAVAREGQEEVGVIIDPADLILVHTMHNFTTGQEWLGVFFLANKWSGKLELKEPHKHSELKWINRNQLPENISPYVRQAIQHYLTNSHYSEYGWDITDDGTENPYR